MPFAAAAVVGTARGSGRALGRRPYNSPLVEESGINGANVVTGLATCACVALNTAGISLLISSLTDTRGALVADYDSQVESWEEVGRGSFSAVQVNITARWAAGRNVSRRMQPSEKSELVFRDSEHEKGLLTYHPLSYMATFDFGSYYPGTNGSAEEVVWQSLPNRSQARHVTFEFSVRTMNGTLSSFATPPLPLAWDETVRARTPAPYDKCRREQHGTWRDKHCHVVKRLDDVCLQVQMNLSGMWRPFRKGNATMSLKPGVGLVETYGCDPKNDWNPAAYSMDACWGHPPSKVCPADVAQPGHTVMVRLRSAGDPFIRAEELTNDTFDFGLSPASERANGIVLLLVGWCLCTIPCARFCTWRMSRRKAEDCRAFRPQHDDPEPGGCPAGVYGNSTM